MSAGRKQRFPAGGRWLRGGRVSECCIDYGPGYRGYLVQRGTALIVLPGGDKRTQGRGIERAKALLDDLEDADDGNEDAPI